MVTVITMEYIDNQDKMAGKRLYALNTWLILSPVD
jgi:hypothetical protein